MINIIGLLSSAAGFVARYGADAEPSAETSHVGRYVFLVVLAIAGWALSFFIAFWIIRAGVRGGVRELVEQNRQHLALLHSQAAHQSQLHVRKGEKLFALGKYDEALVEYEAAYEPNLYNIAQCHRHLGDYKQALDGFRSYLRLLPQAPNRKAVRALIDELEVKLGGAPGAAAATPIAEEDAPAAWDKMRTT